MKLKNSLIAAVAASALGVSVSAQAGFLDKLNEKMDQASEAVASVQKKTDDTMNSVQSTVKSVQDTGQSVHDTKESVTTIGQPDH
ncbi:hypothetical protein [Alloalcanivorax mobilis]|uniref:hypothetical protein n=1 Tax=Alloalcanivorax mobilis TaxID=2019569 RepID=UPI000B5B22BE|nr:hypothetical protein [Alloalcanivorax mobilis]ASK34944.1 hypothetical protein CEK62_11395 [Alcanivorax sp. N3-2A]|tara:strand:+ start:3656 stop:3910 length:255 start_codon:yes stop_codon:yes gene_type:complete